VKITPALAGEERNAEIAQSTKRNKDVLLSTTIPSSNPPGFHQLQKPYSPSNYIGLFQYNKKQQAGQDKN
jgi:hypothetical protein